MRHYTSYADIDYNTTDMQIDAIDEKLKELTESSNEYKTLEGQVTEAKTQSDTLSSARSRVDAEKGRIGEKLEGYNRRRTSIANQVNDANRNDTPWEDKIPEIVKFIDKELTLDNISSIKTSVGGRISKELESSKTKCTSLEVSITSQVATIKEICKDRAFALDISASLNAVPTLLVHHAKLVNEALPDLRTQFDEMMEHDLLKHVLSLNGEITQQISQIKERLTEVNSTLNKFDYNPGTFIRLVAKDTLDKNVENFRRLLQPCLRNQVLKTPAEIEESYKHLEALIDYIKQNREAALAGANANNWLVFAVIEDERATGANVMETSDSAGDSGGQKAKLAFTILAAALCFQYHHSRERDSNAFRLVLVDEMFSKSDDENSRYALELFTKFDFQLLLVTPMEGKARLPMPYVKTYHLVSNPSKKASAITQVSVEAIEAKQKSLHAKAADEDIENEALTAPKSA